MRYRRFGRTGWEVSEIGFGAWQIGGFWGEVAEDEAVAALHAAIDSGVNLIDTADVYGDGRSEGIIGRVLKERSEDIKVLTKAGRRLQPHTADGYTRENLFAFINRSRENLQMDTLDLVQLHCPPTDVYYRPEVFAIMDELVADGRIRHYGVSVERVEEAIKAIQYPGVVSVQIIFNIFRQRPAELFFHLARQRDVAIIARVPLASGLLTGKLRPDTTFAEDDHRLFNRRGEMFNVGETFAGVPYDAGLAAVDKLRAVMPDNMTMAQMALRWILRNDAVSTVIPGARNAAQARSNAAAASGPPLSRELAAIQAIYESDIKPLVHQRW